MKAYRSCGEVMRMEYKASTSFIKRRMHVVSLMRARTYCVPEPFLIDLYTFDAKDAGDVVLLPDCLEPKSNEGTERFVWNHVS